LLDNNYVVIEQKDVRGETVEVLIDQARAYVETVLGTPLALAPSAVGDSLPFFVRDRYALYEGHLLDRRCLLVVPHADLDDLEPPAGLARQFRQIAGKTNATVILLLPTLAAYNRKRLIAQRINFIVAGAQLFIPELAVDLREHHRHPVETTRPEVKTLSPTAQTIVIDALLGPRLMGLIAKDIAATLEVSAMAAGRALDELRATPFTAMEPQGAGYRLYFKLHGRELWDAARPRLSSPVRKVRSVDHILPDPEVLVAGESALASYTSLAEPPRKAVAVHDREWQRLVLQDAVPPGDVPGALVLVETWSYSPRPLARDGRIVDPLSLHLSLDLTDERLEMAADALLETVFG
jgi:hypothetical protein